MTDPRDKRDGDPSGLAAAVAYGVSDFAGGVLTRRVHVFVVFLLSQLVSFALLLVVVALWRDAVSWPGVGWGRRPAWAAWWARPCSTRGWPSVA